MHDNIIIIIIIIIITMTINRIKPSENKNKYQWGNYNYRLLSRAATFNPRRIKSIVLPPLGLD
jgi:hypothetical protein